MTPKYRICQDPKFVLRSFRLDCAAGGGALIARLLVNYYNSLSAQENMTVLKRPTLPRQNIPVHKLAWLSYSLHQPEAMGTETASAWQK